MKWWKKEIKYCIVLLLMLCIKNSFTIHRRHLLWTIKLLLETVYLQHIMTSGNWFQYQVGLSHTSISPPSSPPPPGISWHALEDAGSSSSYYDKANSMEDLYNGGYQQFHPPSCHTSTPRHNRRHHPQYHLDNKITELVAYPHAASWSCNQHLALHNEHLHEVQQHLPTCDYICRGLTGGHRPAE